MAGPGEYDEIVQNILKNLGGGGAKAPAEEVTSQRHLNLAQDYAKTLAAMNGVPEEVALAFLMQQPDLLASLNANFPAHSDEAQVKFQKMLAELSEIGTIGTKLGSKASTLSQSVTTRTLSPNEAESIFNLELKWQETQKQAPLEALKVLAPYAMPSGLAGQPLPGWGEGGGYASKYPQYAGAMKINPLSPETISAVEGMFRPSENEAMQMARQALMRALQTGISGTSTTSTSSNTVSGPVSGATPSAAALIQQWLASQQQPPQVAPETGQGEYVAEPGSYQSPQNWLQQAWQFINPFD